MATIYVQITSNWQDDRWRTAIKVTDRKLANFLAEGLKINENEFSPGTPGIGGVRHARLISKTRLIRESGLSAITQAEADISTGWPVSDVPFRSQERIPYRQFTREGLLADIEVLKKTYIENQHSRELEGIGEFQIKEIPIPLRDKLVARAKELKITASELAIRSINEYLK